MTSSTWSKSDYQFFAEVLHNTPMSESERIYLSNRFGVYFEDDNQRFDWERWNDAIFRNKISGRGGSAPYGGWTRKTYEMTAEALGGPSRQNQYALTITLSEDTRIALISAFGAAFERDNPRFNWDKFRIAAGSPYAPGEVGSWEPKGYERLSPRSVRVKPHVRYTGEFDEEA